MNPVIEAASISGGVGALGIISTAVTAWIGSRNTKRATEQATAAGTANTRATLAAAREERLWEKRAATYEETLAWLLLNLANRFHSAVERDWNESLKRQLEEATSDYESAQWFARTGRLYAYGSDTVLAASDVARRAHREVLDRHHELEQLREAVPGQESALPENAPEREALGRASRKLTSAMEAASAADKELRQLIRDELRSRPEAATPPTAVPAVRRSLWHGRKAVND